MNDLAPHQFTLIQFPHLRAGARAFVLMSPKRKAKWRCKQTAVRAVPTEGGGAWIWCPACKFAGLLDRVP